MSEQKIKHKAGTFFNSKNNNLKKLFAVYMVSNQGLAEINISTSLFSNIPPSGELELCAIVPVKNEADNLVQTLEALNHQKDVYGLPLRKSLYEILLLANNCTDQTFSVAKAYQKAHPKLSLHISEIIFPSAAAHIGTARRMLMDEAYDRFMQLGKSNGIIASTDGDTQVDEMWMYQIMKEIKNGNDAVGGRILIDDDGDDHYRYHSLDELYRMLLARTESIIDPLEHDPWPRHFQYFGASLAVTCAMYHSAGRLPQLPYLEDEAFHQALFCRDAKIRRNPSVKVTTSGRHNGRVKIGLSQQLKKWAVMEKSFKPQMVASAKEVIARLTHRRNLRLCWAVSRENKSANWKLLTAIADDFKLSPSWLQHQIKTTEYFGQLWENIEKKMHENSWYAKWKPVVITTAIEELKQFIALQHQAS